MSHAVSLRTQISVNPPPLSRHVIAVLAVVGHPVMTPHIRLAKPRRKHQKHPRSMQVALRPVQRNDELWCFLRFPSATLLGDVVCCLSDKVRGKHTFDYVLSISQC